jgi:replicative DNA helicase
VTPPPPEQAPEWLEAEQTDSRPPPPHDLDIERALLGAAMVDGDAAAVAASVAAGAWYSPAHQLIADAIAQLMDGGKPADLMSVWSQIRRNQMADQIGGIEGLTALREDGVPSAAKHYRSVVLDHYRARTVLDESGEMIRCAYLSDVGGAVAHAEKVLDSVMAPEGSSGIGDVVTRHLELIEARQAGGIPTVPSGLVDLDRLLCGFRPGGLYIVAARPAMGKSALSSQLTLNVANRPTPVLFATLEMSETELTDRMLATLARVDSLKIQNGELSNDEHIRVANAAARLASYPIQIMDQPEATVAEIRAEARMSRAEMVIVDYLGLVRPMGRHGNRQEEVASIARSLKTMARALNVPVMALCQLHRGVESRSEKRPELSDLRESGEIEQAADAVLMLYRDDYYDPGSLDAGLLEIGIKKNRHGPKGVVMTAFLAQYAAVVNVVHEANRRSA